MAAYVKFDVFSEQLTRGNQDFPTTDTFKLALTNATPNAATDVTFSFAAPAAANGYPAGGFTLTGVTLNRTGGTTTVAANQAQFTATAGGIGPFRYAVLYNSTEVSNNLIAYWDYASSITLSNAGDQFTVQFNGASPGTIFTVT